jgi:hypothetical protein
MRSLQIRIEPLHNLDHFGRRLVEVWSPGPQNDVDVVWVNLLSNEASVDPQLAAHSGTVHSRNDLLQAIEDLSSRG